MLDYRTNLLLHQDDYSVLAQLAEKTNQSIGSLIRHAIRVTYQVKTSQAPTTQDLVREIQTLTQSVKASSQEKKAWIHEGRKYEE